MLACSAQRMRVLVGRAGLVSAAATLMPGTLLASQGTLRPLTRSLQAVATISLKTGTLGPLSYLLLAIPGSAFALGCWQVHRLQWKQNLIKELEEKILAPAIPIPQDLSLLSDLEYQRVDVRGTFDHSKELLLGPRPALYSGRYKENGSMISTSTTGFLVVTPFTLADSGVRILVNRGWVSKHYKDASTRLAGQVTGEQQLTGVVRLQENRAPFMPKNEGTNNFLYRDVETMAQRTSCAPVFLDACESVPGGPSAGQTRITMRNEHLSYLLTWYSLSFFSSCLWYKRYINPRAFI